MSQPAKRSIARNRRARFDFELFDTYEAGLVLTGSEVKSLRAGRSSLNEAYIRFQNGEAWLVGANIPIYPQASYNNHEPDRQRKLLLGRRQIQRIYQGVREKNLTVVPLELYFKGPWVKLEIATARGRKKHDRRQHIRQREDQREMRRQR